MVGPHHPIAWRWVLPVWAGLADSAYVDRLLEDTQGPVTGAHQRQDSLYGELVWALLNDRATLARGFLEEALAIETSGPNPVLPLRRAGQGWADIMEGDTLSGIEKLRSGLEQAGYAPFFVIGFSQPLRFALAAAQAAHPATREEGIRRLRNGVWVTDLVYLPLTYLWLAQALEASGDAAAAAEAYAHFIRLWRNADPELQPRVETARRALERLTGEIAG